FISARSILARLFVSTSYFVFCVFLFFFNDTATTEIYTLSLHDALPISGESQIHSTLELFPSPRWQFAVFARSRPNPDSSRAALRAAWRSARRAALRISGRTDPSSGVR